MANLQTDTLIQYTDDSNRSRMEQSFSTNKPMEVKANGTLTLECNRSGNGGTGAKINFVNNGTTQGAFVNGGALELQGDISWPTLDTPTIKCDGGVTVYLNANNSSPADPLFRVQAYGGATPSKLMEVDPVSGRISMYRKISFVGGAGNQKIETSTGDLQVTAYADVEINANSQSASTGEVRVKSASTTLLTLSTTRAEFTKKIDGAADGIRTKVAGTPSGGESGDIVLDSGANKLWAKIGSNWKSVTLS